MFSVFFRFCTISPVACPSCPSSRCAFKVSRELKKSITIQRCCCATSSQMLKTSQDQKGRDRKLLGVSGYPYFRQAQWILSISFHSKPGHTASSTWGPQTWDLTERKCWWRRPFMESGRKCSCQCNQCNRSEVKITVSSGKCDIHILDMSTGLHFADLRMSYKVMSNDVRMRRPDLQNKDAVTWSGEDLVGGRKCGQEDRRGHLRSCQQGSIGWEWENLYFSFSAFQQAEANSSWTILFIPQIFSRHLKDSQGIWRHLKTS